MKLFARPTCSFLVLLLAFTADLFASGPVGIYGIVEKVVFEPNEAAPQRIQVWGAFEFIENGDSDRQSGATSAPKRGYLYFTLPSGNEQFAVKTEWNDLKAVAGTGQAIAFGNWGLVGDFFTALEPHAASNSVIGYFLYLYPGGGAPTELRVRQASEMPVSPSVYSTNTGIVKLTESSHGKVIKELQEALKNR
jgi:hypothetical protein